ncbi:MAG: alpha/beta hydrolase family protein [Solirubrobacteraceae bacterium]
MSVAAPAAAAAAAPAAAEQSQQVDVTSFDGTKISALFEPADGLKVGEKAPVIMITHGFAGIRETVEDDLAAVGQVGAKTFRAHGYSTLIWDSRGFGRSGGEVGLDSPNVDGRDVSGLINYLATRKDVQLDGPGDPRIGMHGGSYGGIIQWATAINDHRIDAIAPAISAVSYPDALARDGRVKAGWGLGLFGAGEASSTLAGVVGGELRTLPPELIQDAAASAVTGDATPAFTAYLAARDTLGQLGRVTAPALILQGTTDTIFPTSQAIEMWKELKVPKQMLWFCGGHAPCLTGDPLANRLDSTVLAWMDHYVKQDRNVKIGPAFQWAADDNVARSAAGYPLAPAGKLTATGSGTLALASGASGSGPLIVGTVAAQAVEVPIRVPKSPGEVAAEPQLTLHYQGTAQPTATYLYVQLIDRSRDLVVGNQVTPIRVTLDGKPHEVTRMMEGVTMHVTPSSRYALQVIGDSGLYGVSETVGTVDVRSAKITLPLGDPAATKAAQPTLLPPSRGCPLATGRLQGTSLGLVKLGMTRSQARRAYTHSSDRGRRYMDFFCLTPNGVRVGFAAPKLLRTLSRRVRRHIRGRVVWASTSNRHYSLRGIRPGATLTAAAERLHTGRGFRVGLNYWYFAPNGSSSALLKVRHGIVEEIGIADKALTKQRRARLAFVESFS